jgi:hypothetical protein
LGNVPIAGRPADATAAFLTAPDTEGANVPLAPVPTTDAEGLRALAEAVARRNITAGLTRAVPNTRAGACANVCVGAPVINRPASARATLLLTPDTNARIPDTDGAKAPLAPAPETEAEGVCALAEPVDRPVDPAGLLRAAPCAFPDAFANDWDVAPDIDRPVSARAAPLLTPDTDARIPDTDGENDPLVPAPETEDEAVLALAELVDRPIDPVGLLRAVPCALPDACANDRDVAPDIDWLASERAPLLLTPDVAARALDVDGVNATLAPVALAAPSAIALLAEVADWAAEVCGLLRDAFIPEAD